MNAQKIITLLGRICYERKYSMIFMRCNNLGLKIGWQDEILI